ncbi:MAG: flagellar protein FlaG [Methylococcales bacterium]
MNNDITNVTRLAPVINSDAATTRNAKVGLVPGTANSATVSPLPLAAQSKVDVEEQAKEVSAEELKSAVNQGNVIFQAEQRNLQIEVDDSTKKVVVKVIDRATGDIVRQMPTKEVLSFLKQMQEQEGGSGLFIKGRA